MKKLDRAEGKLVNFYGTERVHMIWLKRSRGVCNIGQKAERITKKNFFGKTAFHKQELIMKRRHVEKVKNREEVIK